jgi:hypothetical protein
MATNPRRELMTLVDTLSDADAVATLNYVQRLLAARTASPPSPQPSPAGEAEMETPTAFYHRVTSRPDLHAILALLAR